MEHISKLSRSARAVLIYFLAVSQAEPNGDHVFNTAALMAGIGANECTASRAVRELARAGWLQVVEDSRHIKTPGEPKTATIRLLCVPRPIPEHWSGYGFVKRAAYP